MSEQTAEAPEQTPDTEQTQEPDYKAETEKWKALARKHEEKAKANAEAAKRLGEIEESQKSEAEKAAERLAKAEQRATEAEARALRREIAIEHKLGKEDAELLDSLTNEDAMRRLAERLASAAEDKKNNGNFVPNEGNNPSPPTDSKREFLRGLTRQD